MEHMIHGITLPYKDSTPLHFYSHWLPRQGDAVRMNVEITHALEAKLTIQTKNREETEADVADLGNASVGSGGPLTLRVTGVKELVRFKITTNPSPEMWDEIVHVRLLDPVWEM